MGEILDSIPVGFLECKEGTFNKSGRAVFNDPERSREYNSHKVITILLGQYTERDEELSTTIVLPVGIVFLEGDTGETYQETVDLSEGFCRVKFLVDYVDDEEEGVEEEELSEDSVSPVPEEEEETEADDEGGSEE